MVQALLFKKNKKFIKCSVCFHKCKIKNGEFGVCGVRQNNEGVLILKNYGKVVAISIDPIEKKPLFHFWPGEKTLSFGSYGCNFRCDNCQNYEISQICLKKENLNECGNFIFANDFSPKKIVYLALKNNLKVVAITYNEPTVSLEFALDVMKEAKKENLKTVWVSNGYMSKKTLELIIPHLDAINVDIKSMNDDFYKQKCGARLKPVLENCVKFVKNGVWLEISTLIIPNLTDNIKELEMLAGFIRNDLGDFVPWHLNAFSASVSWKMKKERDAKISDLKKAYKIGIKAGLKYVYMGNVSDLKGETTFCFKCGRKLIERKHYRLKRFDKNGKCLDCRNLTEGIFK
jgi:pyruvate formate lyase activating enzyme